MPLPPESFVTTARERGLRMFTGVPCSYLEPFINYVIAADGLRYVGAANEGEAIAIAAGSELGGVPAVVMFQNSGLGNAVNPLTSLAHTFRIPMLLIATLRGEPGGAPDEPQHELMGSITTRMLDLMDVPWEPFPAEAAAVEPALERALLHMRTEGRPYALVMSRGTVAPWPAPEPPKPRPPRPDLPRETTALERTASRADMIRAVRASAGPDDLLIASTGYTGRELLALGDTDQQLYMVGSMGCASSLALGLAMARPRQRVIVLDGDGAALMRLGALATIGHERPTNLVHLLLDNGTHESTGGQATVSSSVDFAGIAASCGYPRCERTATTSQLQDALERHRAEPRALTFLHAPIKIGVSSQLRRPASSPAEKAARLRQALQQPAH